MTRVAAYFGTSGLAGPVSVWPHECPMRWEKCYNGANGTICKWMRSRNGGLNTGPVTVLCSAPTTTRKKGKK